MKNQEVGTRAPLSVYLWVGRDLSNRPDLGPAGGSHAPVCHFRSRTDTDSASRPSDSIGCLRRRGPADDSRHRRNANTRADGYHAGNTAAHYAAHSYTHANTAAHGNTYPDAAGQADGNADTYACPNSEPDAYASSDGNAYAADTHAHHTAYTHCDAATNCNRSPNIDSHIGLPLA